MSAPEHKPEPAQPRPHSTAEKLRGAAGSDYEEEVEMWEGGYSAKAMYGTWLVMGIVTIVALVALVAVESLRTNQWAWISILGGLTALWIYSIGKLSIRKLNVWYEMTNQRFKHRAGVLTRLTD